MKKKENKNCHLIVGSRVRWLHPKYPNPAPIFTSPTRKFKTNN